MTPPFRWYGKGGINVEVVRNRPCGGGLKLTVDAVSNQRAESRTNLYVMAALSGPTVSGPVKVRNLSPRGALVEGAVLPAARQRVCLRRGALVVSAQVVWCRGGRAGLRFDSHVFIDDWLPQGANRSNQERVDEIVQHLKTGAAPQILAATKETGGEHGSTSADLTKLAEELDALAEDLACDESIIQRHLSRLQTLDIAAQTLRKLASEP